MTDDDKPATWAEFVEEVTDPVTLEVVALSSIASLAFVGFFLAMAVLAWRVTS